MLLLVLTLAAVDLTGQCTGMLPPVMATGRAVSVVAEARLALEAPHGCDGSGTYPRSARAAGDWPRQVFQTLRLSSFVACDSVTPCKEKEASGVGVAANQRQAPPCHWTGSNGRRSGGP